MEKRFYPDHAQRYAHLTPREREEYPDEVYLPSWGWIKREKTFAELCKEPKGKRYGLDVKLLAAKDVALPRALRH